MSAVYKRAIAESVELSKAGEDDWALEILDEALALATQNGDVDWIPVIGRHAAAISETTVDPARARSFYERVLASVANDQESLDGLARLLRQAGSTSDGGLMAR